jgi:cleavage and polyadenylation specificity factor subunit 1
MVQKKDGSWRPCGDYRQLNLQTVEDKYPLPNMADLAARLDGCTIFSKLDLRKGYLQVPVAPANIAKTAIITPFGLFEFLRMPFGLRNAGMTFQHLMDSLLGNLPFAFVYLDNILVASPSAAEHQHHLAAVLSVLQDNGLVVNAEKCTFCQPSMEFLGHSIGPSGIRPLPSPVQAIPDFPRPVTVRQLQAFLGLFNFYRRFIPAAARLVLPLKRALRWDPGGNHVLRWTNDMFAAFLAARLSLSSSAVLDHPAAGAELSLATDASATHVGAVIQQKRPGSSWQPLAFFSAQLDKAQVNYSAFDRELLAVVAAIKHFRYMLEGRSFVVFTDHKPLVRALNRRSDPWSARQQRHLSFVAEFAPCIRHIAGQANVIADALSHPAAAPPPASSSQRPPEVVPAAISGPSEADKGSTGVKVPSGSPVPPAPAGLHVSSSPVDLLALAAAQARCPDCQKAPYSSSLQVSAIQLQGTPILVDTCSGVFQPLVPAAFRRQIFDAIHNLAHPGIRVTRRLIASRFVWPCLASQVAAWCRGCQQCQPGLK